MAYTPGVRQRSIGEGLPLGQFRYAMAPFAGAMATDGLEFAISATADGLAQAISFADKETSKQLVEIGRVISQGVAPDRVQRVYQEVGVLAQRAVVRSYRTARNGQTRGESGYRQSGQWQRYAGGRLLRALSAESFFTATPAGLEFINVGELNEKAAQWARLNFGAAPRGRGSRRSFSVNFSNLVVASIGLNEGPRPGFTIPKGYFVKDGQLVQPGAPQPGTAFYVAGTGPHPNARVRGTSAEGAPFNATIDRKRTRGIEARNFLDAGVAVIAREVPRRMLILVNDLFDEGESSVRPAPVNINVRTHSAFRRSSTSGLFGLT